MRFLGRVGVGGVVVGVVVCYFGGLGGGDCCICICGFVFGVGGGKIW